MMLSLAFLTNWHASTYGRLLGNRSIRHIVEMDERVQLRNNYRRGNENSFSGWRIKIRRSTSVAGWRGVVQRRKIVLVESLWIANTM